MNSSRIFHMLVLLTALLMVSQIVGADPHPGQSVNVAIIGSPGVINGGTFPTTGVVGELGDFTFTNLAPSNVDSTHLAAYDTVLLNVASSEMGCNVNTLSAGAKTDLVTFVNNGGKLIIYDSECQAQDYSWLPYSFTTNNPGAMGATGTLTITEENILSDSTPGDIHYIDYGALGSSTDAVGDMNVMTTLDSNWCLDMSGTNFNQVTGPVHAYAKYGNGLIIYNGLDVDYLGSGWDPADGLRKIWVQELQASSVLLPCGIKVVGITLTPASATNYVGDSHTVTATLTDLLANPQAGIDVTFSVSGVNPGVSGTCNPSDCKSDANGEVTFTYTASNVGQDTITACFVDGGGQTKCDQATKDWEPLPNTPPVADAGGPYSVNEGSTVTLDASGSSDPDGDTLTYMWDLDNDGTYETSGASPTLTPEDGPEILTIGVQVGDGNGGISTDTASVTVNNVAPTIDSLSSDTYLAPIGAPIKGTGTFHDPGILDTFTSLWDWGDSTINSQSLPAGSTSTTYSHAYTTPGVYTVCLTVTDNDGGSDSECMPQYIVIYDPDGGFVTGGGWIDSPEGAYVADSSLTGTANFGFVSKYKKGAMAPTGQTEFQFQAGDLNFHSSSYDWLVIANHKAIYKGTGTINGDGNYGFMLFAIDEKLTPSTGVDMFRIKIWDISNNDAVVYDNEIGEDEDAPPTTHIIGGSIVIHK